MDRTELGSLIADPGNFASPSVWGDPRRLRRIVRGLRAGELVMVDDAFRPAFAAQVHGALDRAHGWRLMQSYDGSARGAGDAAAFHFHHHNIYEPGAGEPELALAMKVFAHAGTRAFIGRLAAADCSGSAVVAANWYRPGDHSTPHSDELDQRRVAFIWYLAREWRAEWGGALYWGPTRRYHVPRFNSLALFIVDSERHHFVTPVSALAQGKRLSINGWWRAAG